MGMELASGRNFSNMRGTDRDSAVIVNEAAVQEIGWQEPLGKTISFGRESQQTIVGVVENFHYDSFRSEIKPLFMTPITDGRKEFITVRVRPSSGESSSQLLSQVEETWEQFTTRPSNYFFLEGAFDRLYESERHIARLFTVFFALTIFIALLGLFGLAAYTVEARRKEISIRKVLGASTGSLVALLSKRFALLVGVAFVGGVPLAWWGGKRWLESFAYRIDLGTGPFLLAGLAVLIVTVATVGLQALRAAQANPTNALRQE
jgi:putative ABC transport system permease protein